MFLHYCKGAIAYPWQQVVVQQVWSPKCVNAVLVEFDPDLGVKSYAKSNPHSSLDCESLHEVHYVITSEPKWLGSLVHVDRNSEGSCMASSIARCKL